MKIFDSHENKILDVEKIHKTTAEWKEILTPEQYRVTTEKETERPFTCTLDDIKDIGIFQCVRCGTDLSRNSTKFHSGTGWPSYYESISDLNIRLKEDDGRGMIRTEVLCARCDAHLGHVFDDRPPPTYQRFCINSAAINFVKETQKKV